MVDRNRFEILEENIESIIDHCREAGIVVCDYQPSVSFQKKINDLVYKLQDVDRMQVEMQDVHVPIELFSKIDAGQNPQLYTRECMEQALGKNEAVRGKLGGLDPVNFHKSIFIHKFA
uniref:Mediator of RNA polymerase II transcription subunit 10 n=1 Tax=Schistosoma japonicum TaxID=6182 RepID=C7TZ55_SCHJA|nr:RNA polymerase II mediator complex subunit 10 [Schistosoma japonicum]